jgi:hypothetical protein
METATTIDDSQPRKQDQNPTWQLMIDKHDLQRLLTSLGVETRRLFFWKHDEKNLQEFPGDWPKTLDYPCTKCGDKFDSIPLFAIVKWNKKQDIPIVEMQRFFCGLGCWKV